MPRCFTVRVSALPVSLCLSLASWGLSASVRAELGAPCVSHDTCEAGSWCVLLVADCETDELCEQDPASGTCIPLPVGKCEADEDCADGQRCVKGELCSAADDPSCVEDPGQRYGACEGAQTVCASDLDCAAGLSCVREGSAGPSACTFTGDCALALDYQRPTLAPSEGVCAWAPRTCISDGQCALYEECAEVSTGVSCSEPVECAPGEPCVDGELPVCTPTVTSLCMPRKLPCLSDAECSSELVCFDFAEHQLKVPEAWEEPASLKSCMAEGLAALFAGEADTPGDEDPEAPQGGGGAGAPVGGSGGRSEAGSGQRGSPGRCSVRHADTRGPQAASLGLGALLVALGYRRLFRRRASAPR